MPDENSLSGRNLLEHDTVLFFLYKAWVKTKHNKSYVTSV